MSEIKKSKIFKVIKVVHSKLTESPRNPAKRFTGTTFGKTYFQGDRAYMKFFGEIEGLNSNLKRKKGRRQFNILYLDCLNSTTPVRKLE